MASRSDAASIFNSSELVESLEPNGSTHCETDSLVAAGKQVALTALAHETRKLTKRQKAQAKKLSKLRLEGFLLDRSSQKGAVVVSTLVPFSGRRAQHQQRADCITSTVAPVTMACRGTCGMDRSECTCSTCAQEWVVETVVHNESDGHLDWFWEHPQLVGMGRSMFPNVKEITESSGAYLAAVDYMQWNGVACFRTGTCNVICVADGGTPRTASLFATFLPQEVHSVDPAMQARFEGEDVVPDEFLPANKKGSLHAHACTIEEWVRQLSPAPPSLECICVVAVHSHVLLEDYVPQLRLHFAACRYFQRCPPPKHDFRLVVCVLAKTTDVPLPPDRRFILLAIPCCVEQRLCNPPGAPTSKGLHRSLHPCIEFNDMAIHSRDRTVRIWDLPAVESLRSVDKDGSGGSADLRLHMTMRTHTDKAKKGNYVTAGGRHRLISDMYGQHH